MSDVLYEAANSVLNVCGHVTIQLGLIQTVISKGKALQEQRQY